MKAPSFAVLFALVLMAGPCESQTEHVRRESFEFAGRTRTFHLFAPISAPDSADAPLIVVLHGSYGRGRDAVAPWVDLARRENFVVAGPDARDKTAWRMRADGPAFARAVVDEYFPLLAARRTEEALRAAGHAVQLVVLPGSDHDYHKAAAEVTSRAWDFMKGTELGAADPLTIANDE